MTIQRSVSTHHDYLRALYRLHELEQVMATTGRLTAAQQAEYHHLESLTDGWERSVAHSLAAGAYAGVR